MWVGTSQWWMRIICAFSLFSLILVSRKRCPPDVFICLLLPHFLQFLFYSPPRSALKMLRATRPDLLPPMTARRIVSGSGRRRSVRERVVRTSARIAARIFVISITQRAIATITTRIVSTMWVVCLSEAWDERLEPSFSRFCESTVIRHQLVLFFCSSLFSYLAVHRWCWLRRG